MTTKKSHSAGMLTVCLAVVACIGTASADWVTTTVPADSNPYAVAANPVTNRIYVANSSSNNVTVIDGATNATITVATRTGPSAVAANPVTNKIYVANLNSDNVTVIDGATNGTTTVAAGSTPRAVAVNLATNKIYAANEHSDNVTVITEAPVSDTKVRAAFDRLPGDTTVFARPPLTGKGVNRATPDRTEMMGVLNRVGTTQLPWDWASVTAGGGTDSIAWSYEWGTDSLIMGENFVCCVPLEDQAATTNNLGLGSPFAGNLEVYPVYRMEYHVGVEESFKPQAISAKPVATVVRGLPAGAVVFDAMGRRVLSAKSGVYFVREEPQASSHKPQAMRKVVVR